MNLNSYINASKIYHDSPESDTIRYFVESVNEFDNDFKNLEFIYEKSDLERSIYGTNDTDKIYQENAAEILSRLGDKIIEIGKKIQAFIDEIIDKIKNLTFSRKTDLEKLEKLARKYPNATINIYDAYANGSLKPTDMKSINELESTYANLIRMCDNKHADGNRIQKLWDKAVKKFDKDVQHWDLEKTLKVATATITLATGVVKLRELWKSHEANMVKQKSIQAQLNREAMAAIKKYSDIDADEMGKMQLKYHMSCAMKGKVSGMYSKHQTLVQKITVKILSGVDDMTEKLEKKAGKSYTSTDRFRDNVTKGAEALSDIVKTNKTDSKPKDKPKGKPNGTNK